MLLLLYILISPLCASLRGSEGGEGDDLHCQLAQKNLTKTEQILLMQELKIQNTRG